MIKSFVASQIVSPTLVSDIALIQVVIIPIPPVIYSATSIGIRINTPAISI